jgi:hypothetical protein
MTSSQGMFGAGGLKPVEIDLPAGPTFHFRRPPEGRVDPVAALALWSICETGRVTLPGVVTAVTQSVTERLLMEGWVVSTSSGLRVTVQDRGLLPWYIRQLQGYLRRNPGDHVDDVLRLLANAPSRGRCIEGVWYIVQWFDAHEKYSEGRRVARMLRIEHMALLATEQLVEWQEVAEGDLLGAPTNVKDDLRSVGLFDSAGKLVPRASLVLYDCIERVIQAGLVESDQLRALHPDLSALVNRAASFRP